MNNHQRIDLNLASHPARNRRLFYTLVVLMGGLFLFLSIKGGFVYFKYKKSVDETQAQLRTIESRARALQNEERQFIRKIEEAEENNRKKIDLINNFILRKSFSWIEFLSALEKALPESSHIISLAPHFKEGSKIEARFRVAIPNLNDLYILNSRLEALKFSNFEVIRESRDDRGFMIFEISLNYETHI